jgi:hypothetical protein
MGQEGKEEARGDLRRDKDQEVRDECLGGKPV